MVDRYVFVNEAGDIDLTFDKEETSNYFVVTAVIIEKDQLNTVEKEMEEIRKKYFQTGTMKLRGLKEERRKEIITAIAESDFHIYSIVTNKKKLFTERGISYQESFFQSMHRMLYRFLFKTDDSIQITTGKTKNKEFVVKFGEYVEERHIRNLFDESEVIYDESASNVLSQLTDMVCDH